jgi:hypothetical protein
MATPYENAKTSYEQITAKLAEVTASLLPNITIDGVTIDRASYYRMLIDMQKLAREQMVQAAPAWEVFG